MTRYLTDFLERKLNRAIVMRACKAFLKEAETNWACHAVPFTNALLQDTRMMAFSTKSKRRYNPSASRKLIALQKIILKRAAVIGILRFDYQKVHMNGVTLVSAVIDGGYVISLVDGQIVDIRKQNPDDEIMMFTQTVHLRDNMTLLGLSDSYLKMVEAVGTNILSETLSTEVVYAQTAAGERKFYLLWQGSDSSVLWDESFHTVDATFMRWFATLTGEDKLAQFSKPMREELFLQMARMRF